MNACKQQEEKMLSWLISRTFKYHFSTSWTFDGSCFNTVRKGFKVKGIPGFGNTSLSSVNTCLRQNIKQCNRTVFPSEKCSNLLLNWEQTSFQVYYCWGSTFSQSVGEYSRALMQNLRWLEAKLFPHVPFIHTSMWKHDCEEQQGLAGAWPGMNELLVPTKGLSLKQLHATDNTL